MSLKHVRAILNVLMITLFELTQSPVAQQQHQQERSKNHEESLVNISFAENVEKIDFI